MQYGISRTLRKRSRMNVVPRQAEFDSCEPIKKARTWEEEDSVDEKCHLRSNPSATASRGGLLTPEASCLEESQTSPLHGALYGDPHFIFPFMKLPAELRINVYHMALTRNEQLLLHHPRPWSGPEDPVKTKEIPVLDERTSRMTAQTVRETRPPSVDPDRLPLQDPIIPEILRLNRLIYKEARQVLYSDNVFELALGSGIYTLSTLHQCSRSLIKHIILTIPSHHDILDGFADLVRLGLRYCWGLKSFKIILQASLPDAEGGRASGATSVYANAFHILRWLPRSCKVVLEGCVSESVMKVVREEGRLQGVLDETSYLKRQHQMPERH